MAQRHSCRAFGVIVISIMEWVGSAFGIAGAVLLSCNVQLSSWGWWLFLVSSISLCVFAVMTGAWGLLALNACFVCTNINGIVRCWLPAMRRLSGNQQPTST